MPFDDKLMYTFTVVQYPFFESNFCVYIKGAPEVVWGICSHLLDDS